MFLLFSKQRLYYLEIPLKLIKWDSNLPNSLLIYLLGRCACFAVRHNNDAIGQIRAIYTLLGSSVTLSRWMAAHTEPDVCRRLGHSWTCTCGDSQPLIVISMNGEVIFFIFESGNILRYF